MNRGETACLEIAIAGKWRANPRPSDSQTPTATNEAGEPRYIVADMKGIYWYLRETQLFQASGVGMIPNHRLARTERSEPGFLPV